MVWHRAGGLRKITLQLCSLPKHLPHTPWRGKDLPVPQSRAALPLGLNMPFPWACVHSAVQDFLTNHGEFSSKALGIFIRLGNDAFTHAVFGKGSLLSSCLGLGRAGGRAAAAREPRQSRQLLLASPRGSHHEGKEQAAEEGSAPQGCPGTLPSSLEPSRLGVFCPQLSLWFAEMTPQGSVGCPPVGFESLPWPGYG